jgi:hypothetical protein
MTSLPEITTLSPTLPAAAGKSLTVPSGLSMSVGLIVLLVLGALCAILGAIYGYIYFTRINPRSNRTRKYVDQCSAEDDQGTQGNSTHLFLFRKSWSNTVRFGTMCKSLILVHLAQHHLWLTNTTQPEWTHALQANCGIGGVTWWHSYNAVQLIPTWMTHDLYIAMANILCETQFHELWGWSEINRKWV